MKTRNLMAVMLLLTGALVLNACKKDKGDEASKTFNPEMMGEANFKIDVFSIGFNGWNNAHQPIIRHAVTKHLYEWNDAAKSWDKLSNTVTTVGRVVQDAQDTYFIGYDKICALDKTTDKWVTVAGITGTATDRDIIANAKGDMVARTQNSAVKKIYFYKKEANSSSWTKFMEINYTNEVYTQTSLRFLTNSGLLYLGDIRKYINTQTETMATLYDETDPANFAPLQGQKDFAPKYITPDGTIYALFGNMGTDLYKMSPNSLPAKFEKVQSFEPNFSQKYERQFGVSQVYIDNGGNIRFTASHNTGNGYAVYYAGTGKISSPKLNIIAEDTPGYHMNISPDGKIYLVTGIAAGEPVNVYKWK